MSGWSLRWKPPGPVCAAFVADVESTAALIMGPFGSGKTSGGVIKPFTFAQALRPCLDGVTRAKFAVVRDTYPNLDKTVIASWHSWVPRGLGRFVDSAPRLHELAFDWGGRRVEIAVEFVALGENRIEDVMRGWEGTGAYVNEADLLAPGVISYLLGRIGRFPPKNLGGCSRSMLWADCNAPDTDNHVYTDFVESPRPGFRFYRQPGGREAGAENVENLPPGYYERLAAANPDWWVRRFVDNQFGASREGKPVYPEFDDRRHVAPAPLLPVRGLPLIVGADAGGTPAASLWQRLPAGQWRGLDELVCPDEETWGPTAFGERLNALLAEPRYAGWRPEQIRGWGDPASQYAGQADEAWLDVVSRTTGIRFRPAPSNSPAIRLEAVRRPLTRSGAGGVPMLQISPTMRVTRKGFNSHYRFRRINVGEGRYADEPEKNHWSHVHDAGQYAILGGGGHADLQHRVGAAMPRPFQANVEFTP